MRTWTRLRATAVVFWLWPWIALYLPQPSGPHVHAEIVAAFGTQNATSIALRLTDLRNPESGPSHRLRPELRPELGLAALEPNFNLLPPTHEWRTRTRADRFGFHVNTQTRSARAPPRSPMSC